MMLHAFSSSASCVVILEGDWLPGHSHHTEGKKAEGTLVGWAEYGQVSEEERGDSGSDPEIHMENLSHQ